MEQLKQIIAEWSVKPDDVKKPYILSAQILNEDNPEKLEFNLILSSDHLVNHLLKTGERKVIGTDYTYQLSVDEIMAMMMGSLNMMGSYCPYGIMLSNRETSGAMKYGLEWTKNQNEGQICGVMGDAASALSCAIEKVFPETDETFRLTCYAHMMKNCNTRLSGVRAKDTDVAKDILDSIRSVADYSIDEQTLMVSLALMYRKYMQEYTYKVTGTKTQVLDFLKYFRAEWTKKPEQFKWWAGANPAHARTNNACERANRTVKEFTHNQKLGLSDLLNKVIFPFDSLISTSTSKSSQKLLK